MLTIDPKEISLIQLQHHLQSAVTPRPIAFASTVDKEGRVNLSPFSFFNVFGTNPPLLVFSPARRVRDNTTKHTYENVLEVQEVVINIVNYAMVQQASLASTEYARGVNEFIKAGFTEAPSVKVAPPRVAEAPVSMECRVLQVVPTGDQGGAGNLILCEVIYMHIREEILGADGRIDPFKLDAVARLGGDWYCRVQGDAIFKVPKPVDRLGIGVDAIPHVVRYSHYLTGNDLGLLGNVEQLPDAEACQQYRLRAGIHQVLQKGVDAVHQHAHLLLTHGKVQEAWMLLLLAHG
ncbi:flavin reductase family protein [Dawidia soli]|uniref:Flavin reductase family protein n=1 Tax=Dawidia soli TaxID=2782352 RepID=A0AAP2GBH4_9BACT|nr:flavin reductase family protein [Dawidia soli]MBT1685144.1 flavin reductase family protein [Dawidia soli]